MPKLPFSALSLHVLVLKRSQLPSFLCRGMARTLTRSSSPSPGSRWALSRRGTEDHTYATGVLCCWQGLGPANPCRVVNSVITKGVWQPAAAESQHWTPREVSCALRRECCLLLSQAPGACMPTGVNWPHQDDTAPTRECLTPFMKHPFCLRALSLQRPSLYLSSS